MMKIIKRFWVIQLIVLKIIADSGDVVVPAIFVDSRSTGNELFAANELKRYIYSMTGIIADIIERSSLKKIPTAGAIVIGTPDTELVGSIIQNVPNFVAVVRELDRDDYWIKTFIKDTTPLILIIGGSPTAVLYGVYRFCYHLGVRYFLDGDVIPEIKGKLKIPIIDEVRSPLFEIRGILPFHDFPEGPDWWNETEYYHVLTQLPKLGMNFIGFHTYPEGKPNAEPTVWIGLEKDVGKYGTVKWAYPASYHNTLRGNWGYIPRASSEYLFGLGQLFEEDAFGSELMEGLCPEPKTQEQAQLLFSRTGRLFNRVFNFASQLGIKTCIGTELPLTIPTWVQQRLKEEGLNPNSREARRKIYEGIYHRIIQTHHLDYYWFWTPEDWTWKGNTQDQLMTVLEDIGIALDAGNKLSVPFSFAVCGWVVGPQTDRAYFGRVLPEHVIISSINRQVGMAPIDPAYREISTHTKWAIPWLEDDPALTIPQLWVGRIRKDAADARRYGCRGLIGIHWRTKSIGPNVAALAEAAWEQGRWNPVPFEQIEPLDVSGPDGGNIAIFEPVDVKGTDDDRIYLSVRYNMRGYYLNVTNGHWRITLKFNEPYYEEAAKRIFSVKLQDKIVIDRLDIFEKVGKNHALDFVFETEVTNEWLKIEFIPIVDFPLICGIVAEGPGRAWKINCGGGPWKDYLGDWPEGWGRNRFAPCYDFYLDWAKVLFGPEVAVQLASIFRDIDGRLPRVAQWVDGPGGITPDPRPIEEVEAEYQFVSWLEAIEPLIKGHAYRVRYHYWLENFRYLREVAKLRCVWYQFQKLMNQIKELPEEERALQIRIQLLPKWADLLSQWQNVYSHLAAIIHTTGELGTIANWEHHIRPRVIDGYLKELEEWLKGPLPPELRPPKTYTGPTRLIVTTPRSAYIAGEELEFKVRILSETMPKTVRAFWRRMGVGVYKEAVVKHINRGVYVVKLPQIATAEPDLELYIELIDKDGRLLRWPSSAPRIGHTMSRMPLPSHLLR